MADVTPVQLLIPEGGSACVVWKWPEVNAGDNCLPVTVVRFPDMAVQFIKGSAFGGAMSFQGSCDPAASGYATLNDPQGNPISSITVDGTIKTVQDHAYLVRPVAGAGVTGVNVFLKVSSGGR